VVGLPIAHAPNLVAGDGQNEPVLSVLSLWPPAEPVFLRQEGLVLREWTSRDVPALVTLFNTPEMDRRTPYPSPFDEGAAGAYVSSALDMRRQWGALQLAITEDGAVPLGEIVIFPTEVAGQVEMAYGVGAQHEGRGLARRAVGVGLDLARKGGAVTAILHIAVDNAASHRVAQATGFALQDDHGLIVRRRKGQVVQLAVWRRAIQQGGRP
jgi:RimJ/RimL family protein N-acetyltransferase